MEEPRFFCSNLYFLKKLREPAQHKRSGTDPKPWQKNGEPSSQSSPSVWQDFVREAYVNQGNQAAIYCCLFSSTFEQPGFPKNFVATLHVTVDKWRWSSLWKIGHSYWAAADKHASNYAGAQIPQYANAFPSSHSCHAWKDRKLLPGVEISAEVIFQRTERGIIPVNYTPELWRTVMRYTGKRQEDSFFQQNIGRSRADL